MNKNTVTPATKEQLDALIDIALQGGYNEAAGLLKLGSILLSEAVHKDGPTCCCYEVMGDNKDCPEHGHYFTQADERERADLYAMGMGG